MLAGQLFKLVTQGDLRQLRGVLQADHTLANAGVPCSDAQPDMKGHPLHRICDLVFAKAITEEHAIEIAKALLEYGADINGYQAAGDKNTPLIAAASLHAEQLGIFYIQKGADIFYADHDGATALHWAAFCGRDHLVAALIAQGANIDQQDTTFNSTPIGWAVHSLTSGDTGNLHNQLNCIQLLLIAGADRSLLDQDTLLYLKHEGI